MGNKDKPYYDHDPIWSKRAIQGNPVWGSYSQRMYSQVLQIIEELKPSEKSIADIGCGAGAFGKRAEEAGYKYIGVDASAVAIELGLKYEPSSKLAVIDFAAEEIHDFATFPIVTSINVLHCLTGKSERSVFLKNLHKICAPGGYLILTTMCGPVDSALHDTRIPRSYFTADEIKSELITNGWKKIIKETKQEAETQSPIPNLTIVCSP